MSYPSKPSIQTSYTAVEQAQGDGLFPGQELDVDLSNLKSSVDALNDFVRGVTRSDGRLANASVSRETLAADILLGFAPPETWVTAEAYAPPQTVFFDNAFYLCVVSHTSGVFATDLASGRWSLLVDFGAEADAASASAAAAAASETAAAGSASAAASSASAASGSATAASGSASAAASSATAASGSATAASGSASAASTSATNAASSASAAATSATNAATSETNAAASAADAANRVPKTSDTGSAVIPAGTTAQRDGVPVNGYFRYNSTTNEFEGYAAGVWGSIGGGGGGFFKGENGAVGDATTGPGDIFRINEQTLNTSTTIDADENASATGPLAIASGVTLTVTSGGSLAIL